MKIGINYMKIGINYMKIGINYMKLYEIIVNAEITYINHGKNTSYYTDIN